MDNLKKFLAENLTPVAIFTLLGAGGSLLLGLAPQPGVTITVASLSIFMAGLLFLVWMIPYQIRQSEEKTIDLQVGKIIENVQDVRNEIGKHTELLTVANKLGLLMVYHSRNEIRDFVYEGIRKGDNVNILGIATTTPSQMQDFKNVLISRLKYEENFYYRVLYLDPANRAFFNQRAFDEFEKKSKTVSDAEDDIDSLRSATIRELKHMLEIRESLDAHIRRKVEMRVYNAFPYLSMFVIGEEMCVGGYLFRSNCPNMPMLRVKEGPIYKNYLNHFNSLWASSEKIEKEDDIENPQERNNG